MRKLSMIALLTVCSVSVHADDTSAGPEAASSGPAVSAAATQIAPAAASSPSSSGELPNNGVGIKLGPGLRGLMSVTLNSRYNSNYFFMSKESEAQFNLNGPISAIGGVLSPSFTLFGDKRNLRFQLGVDADLARFRINSDKINGADSYANGDIKGNFQWFPLTRHHFSGDFAEQAGHDPIGSLSVTAQNFALGFNKWLQHQGHLRYRFGADNALINLESEVGVTVRRYTTNRDLTQFFDYRDLGVRETGFLNISSKTSLLAEVTHDRITHFTNTPQSDTGQENHIRVGMHWLPTAHISGDVRVGQFRHDFDNPTLPGVKSVDWVGSITWAPLVYSVINIQTGLQVAEPFLEGTPFLENRYVSLNWTHDWSSLLRTQVTYGHVRMNPIATPRVDETNTGTIEGDLRLASRWFALGGVSYSRNSSNQALFNYNNTAVYLGIRYAR